jgi:hypothetical protein
MRLSKKIAIGVLLCIAAIMLLSLCGCSMITGSRTMPDGSVLRVSSVRLLWSSEGIDTTTEDGALKFGLRVQRSNPDAQALSAVAEGAARGATK